MIEIKAKTVRAAKMQVKRLHPKGGTIFGSATGVLVYHAQVDPQHMKLPGGRTVFSNRSAFLERTYGLGGHYPKGTDTSTLFTKPDSFIFEPLEGT